MLPPSTPITLAFVFLVGTALAQYDSDIVNKCPQVSPEDPNPDPLYYSHPDDCTKYVSCAFGLPYVMECPNGTVFSDVITGCVHEEGPYNKCAKRPENKATCQAGSRNLIPHPDFCQRYYNCSDHSDKRMSYLGKFEEECDYPDLFDYVLLKCMSFKVAKCAEGTKVGVQPCDYVRNQCVSSHCEPCSFRAPSCLGKPDGLHENTIKLWTPFHVRCESNRSVEFLECPFQPPDSRFRMLFSPERKACIPLWEIPKEKSGLQPDCAEKEEGRFFATDESDRVFYDCPFSKVFFCDKEEVFSEESQKCVQT
ncbi:uncharacterized protein LOC101857459 [Aplysia californica]|uniref:Uncharacterized protein LOC101857459 n=1 Tax=Aplysia californica TaxID=6500 RepID=A0ABM1VVM0_APLCA|nr:uncharacterized protein LOC101857459 [Aplysia californica]